MRDMRSETRETREDGIQTALRTDRTDQIKEAEEIDARLLFFFRGPTLLPVWDSGLAQLSCDYCMSRWQSGRKAVYAMT